jgi:SAM-dependent methyltransferase
VGDYASFARFYDTVMGDPLPKISRVAEAITRHSQGASSVLELGCGTGSILAGLPACLSLTGLDRSPEMLAIARSKVPKARFIEADISSFHLGERFDVIICVFDTLNHLPRFDLWEELFQRVFDHLSGDGLFVFDVNPIGQLRRLSEAPPWVHHFDGNTLVVDVSTSADSLSCWDIRVFEHLADDRFRLHQERIEELGVELAQIKAALSGHFTLVEEADPDGATPTDDSPRAYFVVRRR